MRILTVIMGVSLLAFAAVPVAAAQEPVDYEISEPGVYSGNAKGPYTYVVGPGLVAVWDNGNIGFDNPIIALWGIGPESFQDPLLGYEQAKGMWLRSEAPVVGTGLETSYASFGGGFVEFSPSYGAYASTGDTTVAFQDPLLGHVPGATLFIPMPEKVIDLLP